VPCSVLNKMPKLNTVGNNTRFLFDVLVLLEVHGNIVDAEHYSEVVRHSHMIVYSLYVTHREGGIAFVIKKAFLDICSDYSCHVLSMGVLMAYISILRMVVLLLQD
jgi:hypothetical protein